MKYLFYRNTHDENNQPFWWIKDLNSKIKFYGLGIHALSTEGTTFDEYINFHLEYKKSFLDYEIPTYIELLEDLIKMLKMSVCIIKEEK